MPRQTEGDLCRLAGYADGHGVVSSTPRVTSSSAPGAMSATGLIHKPATVKLEPSARIAYRTEEPRPVKNVVAWGPANDGPVATSALRFARGRYRLPA